MIATLWIYLENEQFNICCTPVTVCGHTLYVCLSKVTASDICLCSGTLEFFLEIESDKLTFHSVYFASNVEKKFI